MDLLNHKETQDQAESITNIKPGSEEYSVTMVDTIFADTLSRGMQNAITSQQNAQMASSTSITNACARILQARASSPAKATAATAEPASVPAKTPSSDSQAKTTAAPLKSLGDKLTAIDNTNHFNPSSAHKISSGQTSAKASEDTTNLPKSGIGSDIASLSKFKKTALFLTFGVLMTGLLTAGLYFLHYPATS